MHTTSTQAGNYEAAILARVVQPGQDDFPPEAAQAVLKFSFGQADRDRMHELAVKNQQGTLTLQEKQELASYRPRRPIARPALRQSPPGPQEERPHSLNRMDDDLTCLVWQRAGDRCEYCHLPQAYITLPFEIDHIIALKHRGPTVANNLALSCFDGNNHKGPSLSGIDWQTSRTKLIRLFNPRLHPHVGMAFSLGRPRPARPDGDRTGDSSRAGNE